MESRNWQASRLAEGQIYCSLSDLSQDNKVEGLEEDTQCVALVSSCVHLGKAPPLKKTTHICMLVLMLARACFELFKFKFLSANLVKIAGLRR